MPTIRKTLLLPATLSGAGAPLDVLASGEGAFSHLETDAVIIAILLSNMVMLLGFLIRLNQMRGSLSRKARALETNEKHLQLMGDNLPNVAIFQLVCAPGRQFSFNYLSKGYARALGMNRDAVMKDAMLAFDHVYEADIPALQHAYEEAEARLSPADLEIRVLDMDGNLRWFRIRAVPHREPEGLVWDGFMQDVSDNKAIECALLEEKRNFQNLFETIDDFLLVCDMEGQLLHANPSVERRLNYSREELRGMSVFELYPESSRAEAYRIVAAMQTEESTSCAIPLQTKSGKTIPVDMNIFQGTWKNTRAIFGVARDVAGRQSTENALRESQQMLKLIMNTIPMAVFWKDKDSIYLGCNQTFVKECGLTGVEDVVGKTPYDLFDRETAEKIIADDQQVISSNQPKLNFTHALTERDGSVGWREASKIPLRDGENRAVGVLGVWRDITEKNRAEERLKRTLEDMERFNQLMRGRERRTLELKAEINTLLKELGKPIKYRTTTDSMP